MTKKDRSPEEKERRAKIRVLPAPDCKCKMNGFAALGIRPFWLYALSKAAADKPLPPQNILLYSVSPFGVYTEFGRDPFSAVSNRPKPLKKSRF